MVINTWFPHILSYDLFFVAGLVIFFAVFVVESKRSGIEREKAAVLAAIIIFSGVALSHALKYLFPDRISISLYVAAIGSIIGGGAYALLHRIPLRRIGDAATPAAALAFAIMKLGCLAGGCCYGVPTSSTFCMIYRSTAGVALPKVISEHPELSGIQLVPTQLWVAILCFSAFAASFVILPWSKKRDGRRLGVVLGIYALGRFIIDFSSGSPPVFMVGPLSANQIFGIAMVVVSIVLISFPSPPPSPPFKGGEGMVRGRL